MGSRRRVRCINALFVLASGLAFPFLTLQAQLPARTLGPVSGKAIGFIDLAGRDVVDEMKRGENSPYIAARSFHEGFAGVQRLDASRTT